MHIRDRRELKQKAAAALVAAPGNYKHLISIHIGVTLAVSFVLSVLQFVLEEMIGSTGGLGGVGTRALLETAQSALQLIQTVALPFWQFGWLCTVMAVTRQENTSFDTLLTGFRRFGPYLRLMLLQLAIYFALGMAGSYIATAIFMLTPWAAPMMDLYTQLATENLTTDALYAAMEGIMADSLLPLMLIFAGVFFLLAAPTFYRLRFAPYCLADDPEGKAFAAAKKSLAITRRNAFAIFRLDLSFWWFYALELLITVIAYLDLLLDAAGTPLPGPSWLGYFGTLAVYAVVQWLLYRWRKPYLDATYVKAYESLLAHQTVPKPQNFPWSN